MYAARPEMATIHPVPLAHLVPPVTSLPAPPQGQGRGRGHLRLSQLRRRSHLEVVQAIQRSRGPRRAPENDMENITNPDYDQGSSKNELV